MLKKLNTNLVGLEQILVFPDGAVSDDIYPTHIVFNNVDIYFECVNEEKYLVFALTDKNLDILENYKKLWDKIKMDIKKLEGIVGNLYFEKDIMTLMMIWCLKNYKCPYVCDCSKSCYNMIINFILEYIYIVVILIVLMMRVVMYV